MPIEVLRPATKIVVPDRGPPGVKGNKPAHYWSGTTLAFENPDGSVETPVDLKGATGNTGATGPAGNVFASRTAIAARPSTDVSVFLNEAGRSGQFVALSGNYTDQVTADPGQGVYVPFSDDATGATKVWARPLDHTPVPDLWFGVQRGAISATTGPDSTVALQRALDFCYSQRCDLILTKGSAFVTAAAGATYALLNKGVSMRGDAGKSTFSPIYPLTTMPSTADFIRFEPEANSSHDFIQFSDFMIQPTVSGTAYGKRALTGSFGVVTNAGQLAVKRMYFGPGKDYSLYLNNNVSINAQGIPSNSVIEECTLWDGVYMTGLGDNVDVRDNFIETTAGSGRYGVFAYLTDGSGGVASMLRIERNAMNADNCAIMVDRGRNVRIRDNNIEHSKASTPTNATVIHLRGSGGTLAMPIVEGNAIGIFGSSLAQIGINVASCEFAQINTNNIITDVTRTHAIIVAASSTHTRGLNNKVSAAWTNNITDNGTDTVVSGFLESSL